MWSGEAWHQFPGLFPALQPSVWVWRGPEPAAARETEGHRGLFVHTASRVCNSRESSAGNFGKIKIVFADPRSQRGDLDPCFCVCVWILSTTFYVTCRDLCLAENCLSLKKIYQYIYFMALKSIKAWSWKNKNKVPFWMSSAFCVFPSEMRPKLNRKILKPRRHLASFTAKCLPFKPRV